MLGPVTHQVLVVEDDDGIALPLVRTLEREGYAVTRVTEGQVAVAHVAASPVDLVVLDLGLPDVDGLDVCRQVREGGYGGGILILTARGGELDRVVGLDVGADDYLPKPFALAELMARTRALLRRAVRPTTAPLA
ncbi:MAG: response regulator, partial [Actinotalea sp.]|nr:response regulator [Actinotalea sp.]